MRVVGRREQPLPCLRWPTAEERRFLGDKSDQATRLMHRRVVVYVSHEAADVARTEMRGEEMARRAAGFVS